MVATHFGDFKLRWKLAIIFPIIPLLIFYFYFRHPIFPYLNVINIPAVLISIFILWAFESACDGLGCLILGIGLMAISIGLFYGSIGYLVGYFLEKKYRKKKK